MPDHYSAVYHVGLPRRARHASPGRLVHVEDYDGAWADIHFHALHVRQELVWEFNWLTSHQVGSGLWQQEWTHEGRMQVPAEGLAVAVSGWELVPSSEMPRGRRVLPIEQDGSCIWLIRQDSCTRSLCDEMNRMLERIAGDGLWLQYWYQRRPDRRPARGVAPQATPHRAPELA
ncbi:hypothetical protein [Streptomyces sp. STCH 565 A]|uniref:hypothetical protein n=1 Tax=Streptomyces sp. STCH 565 A TaxID=2950532 RepID=UPI002075BF4F|nr:hypothetical protein [Streptomyces sp. STCH 565 A]MCM8548865.1 hypothetical protein [Streptomyces sp. STCH 565 A]